MNEASRTQNRAAEPDGSIWLAANAGSGKTKVLIDRVARLLLRGTPPQRILCLTYTKAAASEMQNRLFARLGAWAMLDDDALSRALADLDETVRPEALRQARQLFARAIETPGGLKIQTIHAFCSSLLRRFPLEAGVSPDFSEIDERSLAQLKTDVLDQLASGPEADVLRTVLRRFHDDDLHSLLDEIGIYRDCFEGPAPDLDRLFGLDRGFDEPALLARVLTGSEARMAERMAPFLARGLATDARLASLLSRCATMSVDDLPVFEDMLLYKADAKTGPFTAKVDALPTKAVRSAMPADLQQLFADFARRIEAARPLRLGLESRRMAEALHAVARLWIPALDAAKARRGWLDFDDLIRLAGRLLGDSQVAQWVLYKLDGGIDHVLVDEAQDTSPAQWRVIDLLTQEFTAGQGARDQDRTVFVVGDRKQSIYSFQGADLDGFEAARRGFAQRLSESGQGLAQLELHHSFRSSDAILRLVDACFATAAGGLGGAPTHLAFRPQAPGRVDLWPAVPKAPGAEETEWDSPLDRLDPADPQLVLAKRIADELRSMIDRGEQIVTREGARALHEGDVLILVRRRGPLFDAIIRACKAVGLAIAGADRLKLGSELAVQDLLALLRFLALPEDDLSLAVALRSPVFGLGEDDLYRLAQGREGFLWTALRNDPKRSDIREILQDLRDQVDFLRPHELLERILIRHDGRRRIRARLGEEVSEAVEALVDLALIYERDHVPTLDGFLEWIAASDAEIKRQPPAGGRRLRVMTIHGAKGLEAPLVILPDTDLRRPPNPDPMLMIRGVPVLRAKAEQATPAQIAAAQAEASLARAESDRLLYVALTRAESWLILCGAGETEDPESWHSRVSRAVAEIGAVPIQTPVGAGLRHEHADWPVALGRPAARLQTQATEFRPVLEPLPQRRQPARLLVPTALGGAKALPGLGDESPVALARGALIHRLLQELPCAERSDRVAAQLIAGHPDGAACLAEARALIADPAMTALFAPEVLVEVALSGLWRGYRMWGVIDRLVVTPDKVLAVDFKSNRSVPVRPTEVPEGLLRQMGAYAHLLAEIYPGRRVETCLVWTATRSLMMLDPEHVAAALDRAALDPGLGRP